MKTRNLLLILLIGLLFSCQQADKKENPAVFNQTLTSYFDGIKSKNLDMMKSVTTDDFVLYEDGKVWNNDSLFNFLNSLPPYTAKFTFTNINVDIDNSVANMYYFNHMDMTLNDTIEDKYDWIESATFKKVNGEWKINFLHSSVRD